MSDMKLDLDGLVDDAWRRFRGALADALDALDEGESLQVVVDGGHEDGASPYVQVVRAGDVIVLEVASNRFLAPSQKLPKSARRRLRELGLAKPTETAPNYSTSFPATHADQVASVAVAAFREAYGVVHPSFLVSEDVRWTIESQLATTEVTSTASAAIYPVSRDHLDELIDQALTPMLGHAPERDSDGDIPVHAGTAVVFVRSHEHSPVIRLFAEMAVDIGDSDAARHEVDVLNREVEGVKFALRGDTVIASADLVGFPFAAEHLVFLLAHVCDVVSSHDATLARRIGGRAFLDVADAVDQDEHDLHDLQDESDEHAGDPVHRVMLSMLQLDAEQPGSIRPKDAAKLCGYDSDLLLDLIRWNEEQELAWRKARDEANATDEYDEAEVCEIERAHARRTVKVLRRALRRVLLG